MIIDIIEAIITSPYGSGRSQKPGQFDSLKRESLVHKIIDDPQAFEQYKQEHQDSNNILEDLMNKSDKYLKEFYEKYAEVQNPNDILWYINQHYNLMQGNDLIGGAAVASSNQLKLQNLPNFSLKNHQQINYLLNIKIKYIIQEVMVLIEDYLLLQEILLVIYMQRFKQLPLIMVKIQCQDIQVLTQITYTL